MLTNSQSELRLLQNVYVGSNVMSVRLLLTDEAWAEIASLLAKVKSGASRPPVHRDRLCIEAVLYRARTGLPWRDLPQDFGHWDALSNRLRRWQVRRIWRRLWGSPWGQSRFSSYGQAGGGLERERLTPVCKRPPIALYL